MMLRHIFLILQTAPALHTLLKQQPMQPGYLFVIWKSQIQGPFKAAWRSDRTWLNHFLVS